MSLGMFLSLKFGLIGVFKIFKISKIGQFVLSFSFFKFFDSMDKCLLYLFFMTIGFTISHSLSTTKSLIIIYVFFTKIPC